MKKRAIALIILVLFSFLWTFSCDITQDQYDGSTVYITDTGEKFHRSDCRYLHSSKIEISRAEAKRRGYTACSVCDP